MRFMMVYKPATTTPQSRKTINAVNKPVEEARAAGTLVASEGLHPLESGAKVRLSDGVLTVVDGPFAEAKEVIAGYAIFQLKSKEEAIEAAKGFLKICGDGEVEVRQIIEKTDSAIGG